MGNPKQDRRVRKTKKQLRLGLTKLMQEKSINEITVRELADEVDINRGTFYIHYKDVYDMVDQIEKEIFEEFSEIITENFSKPIEKKPFPFLKAIFNFLAENSDLCTAFLGKNGDMAFVEQLKGVVKTRFMNHWLSSFKHDNPHKLEYLYSYIVSGFIGLIQNWLANGMQESPEEMATLTELMIVKGSQILE